MYLRWARVLTALLALGAGTGNLWAQTTDPELGRRTKIKVAPAYPLLAQRMRLSGTVKLQVVVAANGSVKEARVLGGNPVLANAALDALKKWRFEPAALETTGMVDFTFAPPK